jgi:Na+/H+ antiporter NhaC
MPTTIFQVYSSALYWVIALLVINFLFFYYLGGKIPQREENSLLSSGKSFWDGQRRLFLIMLFITVVGFSLKVLRIGDENVDAMESKTVFLANDILSGRFECFVLSGHQPLYTLIWGGVNKT